MNIRNAILGFSVLLTSAVWCGAETEMFLMPDAKIVNLPWITTDGAGFTWDIYQNGNVQHGTNNAYGNGMMLQLQGRGQFYVSNNKAVIRGDDREIQLEPYKNGKLQVWRRIYVDPKLGYARWIDIFENTDTKPLKLDVQYQNHMGNSVRQCISTTEKTSPGGKDWGFVTNDQSNTRPAVMHVYTSKRAKHRPRVQVVTNNNRILYDMTLTIPPGEMRALCFFEAQRNTFDEATKLMKTFRPERELAKVPKALRNIIVNMSGDVLLIGRLDLPRSRTNDTIVMRDDSEVHGTILNPSFPVETFFGKLDLPADRVVGLAVLDPNDRFVQIALTDGQIVGGVLGKEGLKVRLADEKELTLPPHRVATLGYQISPKKPEEIHPGGAMLLLRSGQRLRFDPSALPLEFLTEYGPLRLPPDDLCELRLAESGRLHQAVFRNGSILTGLLQTETVKTPLSLGPKLTLGREMLAGVLYHRPGQTGGPFRLRLRNDDVLLGDLADKTLPVQTELGQIDVPTERIRTLRRLDGAPGRIRVQLADETTISGTLQRPTIRFQITPDVELPVFVGHVVKLQHGTPKKEKAENIVPAPAILRRPHTRAELMAAHRQEIERRKAVEREKNRPQRLRKLKAKLKEDEELLCAKLKWSGEIREELAKHPEDKDFQAAMKESVEHIKMANAKIAAGKKKIAALEGKTPASQPATKPRS